MANAATAICITCPIVYASAYQPTSARVVSSSSRKRSEATITHPLRRTGKKGSPNASILPSNAFDGRPFSPRT